MRLPATVLALLVPLLGGFTPARGADLSSQVHQVLVLVSESIGTDADGMVANTFNAMDVNRDGHVTPDEFQALTSSRTPTSSANWARRSSRGAPGPRFN
jgi:hypothetical protein